MHKKVKQEQRDTLFDGIEVSKNDQREKGTAKLEFSIKKKSINAFVMQTTGR